MTAADFDKVWKYVNLPELNAELGKTLEEDYQIEEMDVEDVFTSSQLSKIELRKEYIYTALQFPEFSPISRSFLAKELHIFVNRKYIFLINKHNLKHANNFHLNKETIITEKETAHPFNLFYELLDYCISNDYRVLPKFRREIESLSVDIFDSATSTDKIMAIQEIKRNLVDFISLMEPLREVLTDLQTRYHSFIDAQGVEKLDDSLDKIKKILNNLRNFQEQINIIAETNEAIIARSTNKSIHRLTLINITLLVPTIITSFFGMNVYFGWEIADPRPIIYITSTILLLTSVILLIMRFRRFFPGP